jgi:hypothetical protein
VLHRYMLKMPGAPTAVSQGPQVEPKALIQR